MPTQTSKSPQTVSLAQLRKQLSKLLKEVYILSETDARALVVSSGPLQKAPLTSSLVRSKLKTFHDANFHLVMNSIDAKRSLATLKPAKKASAAAWLKQQATATDPNDATSVAQAQKMHAVKVFLETQFKGLTLFRFGEIEISVFVLGRTHTDELFGFLTGLVET
jgi:Nuclease A inhibitor-like protein